MLEGAVARLLNQILGKYVVDLDTENLNVGIFSGLVQLTDLKLKPEALYELRLPIEVRAGTIGKVWLQIPWTTLWNQPIIINIEDVHVIAGPVVTDEPFDEDKNKRLSRAAKRKALADLDNHEILGGPSSFSEHLITNILNYFQLNITNVHIRYEDNYLSRSTVAMGLCIGSITAESTNSKWRPCKYDKTAETSYYVVKLEAFSLYWNTNAKLQKWDLPSKYYQWRNSMSASLQSYSLNEEEFNFVVNPMSAKIKMVINKTQTGHVSKLYTDIVAQDCNIELTKEQYDSILNAADSMERMLISWQFLAFRPSESIRDNQKDWWRYASYAVLEQRVKPYTWSRIKRVRRNYKQYMETYKKILLNPNDTELKMDLQKYEDNLSIVNVVLARQQARLTVQERSQSEKSFWSMLPSPERILLCEEIGCFEDKDKERIDHTYNFRLGIISITLTKNCREIAVLTVTQTVIVFIPKFIEDTFRVSLKIEAIIIEGCSNEDHLMPIISSEHLSDSPAYFLKMELSKMPKNSISKYKFNIVMDSVECIYDKPSIEEIELFFTTENNPPIRLFDFAINKPDLIKELGKNKLLQGWEFDLNIKIPHVILPEVKSYLKAEYLLIVDLGKFVMKTELCQESYVAENSTKMELEEQLYTKLFVNFTDFQILFCDNNDNWKDAKKEKCSDLHVIPQTSYSAICAVSVAQIRTIPSYKFNVTIPNFKINISERKVLLLLKFFNIDNITINVTREEVEPKHHANDKIKNIHSNPYLKRIQGSIQIPNSYVRYKRYKVEASRKEKIQKDNNRSRSYQSDMNEAWARCVDLPGLEDNISPNNNIKILYGFVINEFSVTFSRSSDSTDRQYLMLRLGYLTMDVALMTYGPAYQITLNSIILTDKLHTTPSGQYLELLFSPISCNQDVTTILYRKVSARCPDFWTHFHGVETSLVANLGSINILLHQEAVRTAFQYSKYISNKIRSQTSPFLKQVLGSLLKKIKTILHSKTDIPVPPGSIKFSHSARLADLNVTVCDSDFDIVNIQLSGLELDFLFRANERFVFRSFLSNITVEHLSDITLYSKVLYTDEDKVFDIKYVRNSSKLGYNNDISPNIDESFIDGSFKFQLGRIHFTFLYKLIVQLQRFVTNLEALPFIENLFEKINIFVIGITKTLKPNTKINLDINVSGPVLLFPQKSSSPNVLIVDTGQLKIENFFKDYPQEITENILVKLKDVMASRGVMSLTSTLETQETLIEPVNLNMDIKRYTNSKNPQSTWEIDGIIDSIHVTLGQRDIITMISIFTDNIGEGKILDLFPTPVKSPTDILGLGSDETVRNLEAFFCESKQKCITAKCCIEEIKLLLFFDSGELLSSPIRDLNHGLCKLEIIDIDVSISIYNDKSLDGKLSIDTMYIEEIGPDVNGADKTILQSPTDDNKNNNCNITVNKPPIVDVTFHENKTRDKSADVIIGKLSLSLSIPFSEKLALFIIECIPKETADAGIVNPGYEAETYPAPTTKSPKTSLTLSIRINKPELIFLVETTSNKKRYFITKSEILIDYSRHSNILNLITSLSGLHSSFYDLNEYSEEPYVILRQCDVELCKSYSNDTGEKITLAISSIYLKLCGEVVHSFNDILNDIIEHFKIPEVEVPKSEKNLKNTERDLWEPKKLTDFITTDTDNDDIKTDNTIFVHEILLVPKFEVVVLLELEQVRVLIAKITVELTLYDWSSILNCTCEITLQANYFNENVQSWEPIIEPITIDEKEYKPWEVVIKIFQDKSMPMLDDTEYKPRTKAIRKKNSRSVTTTEDEDSGEDMIYLEPLNTTYNGNRRVKTSLSTFLEDSDSENEDGAIERLAAAISDLFTGDWNEIEDSDCGHSSEGEDDEENPKPKEKRNMIFNKSYYILLDAKETLNVTLTPTFLQVANELFTQYSNKIISVKNDRKLVILLNDVGPNTKIELYEKINAEDNKLICTKRFENEDSAQNSPTNNMYLDGSYDDKDSCTEDGKDDFEGCYDFDSSASLQFPDETTPQLYERINKNFLKIFIPNFQTIQTNCSKRNWEKLLKLNSTNSTQTYYLAAKHSIGKTGRKIIISSPLQIKNETCFALSLLYEPSILQQLNLEPVGDMTNPFETTMRIAVLEPQEEYNVPLYIAYHCKLFIQPVYAEGHYASDSGIWWKDLATEMDTAHDIYCRPKSDSNLEIFSIRILLKKNIESKTFPLLTIPNYVIHLLPPLVVNNFLPYSLEILNGCLKQSLKVEPGEKNCIYTLDFSKDQKLQVKVEHNGTTWTGTLNFTKHLDEKVLLLNTDNRDEVSNLAINIKSDREDSCHLFFYTSYWIVNKTGLPLQIKASISNTIYNCMNEDILLFTYKRHGKQTLNVRVYESNWSNEFSLECVGTTGLIICKDVERKKKYMFFLNTRFSNICPRLTKIVTIVPSFLVTNNTDKHLRFMEHNDKTDLWIDLAPFKTLIFWPETSSMEMYVKYKDSKLISHSFFISTHHRTVLRLDKGGAITVEVTGGEKTSFRISFNEYKIGDAPVLIKNYCADLFLKIQQQDLSPVTLLNPYYSLLYTWDDPTRSRKLVWNVYNNKGNGFSVDITKDGFGEEKMRIHSVTPTSSLVESSSSDDSDSSDNTQHNLNKKVHKDKITIYWLCYREGVQRVLLLTQELRIYNSVMQIFLERCHLEGLIALSGVGLSIFTSEDDVKERIYAALTDTPAIWEVNVGQKWKTLTLELASWVEDKYRLHYKKCQLKNYVHIDFEKMYMLKPFFAELRRSYSPAIYFHFRKSQHYQYYNFKVQSFQIDNQQTNNIVLQPLPSQNLKDDSPFADISTSVLISKGTNVYRYIKFNVGSFFLSIENDLLLELSNLLKKAKKFVADDSRTYVNEIKTIHKSITATNNDFLDNVNRTIIEYLVLKNFGIQLNISNKTQMKLAGNRGPFSTFLDYLFPYNMSPYMPLEGVHHKICSLEHIDIKDTISNAISNMCDQVYTQFLQQYYSHVLGLQVLVNTFAIQPSIELGDNHIDKMANILFYASRCLLGHINMSPVAVEASVSDIFVHQNIENIQRIRRHGSYHKSEIVPKTITISSRNFVTGVPNALDQLIVKNQNGINCDGETFFRTTGKALQSLITRHPDEKSDSVEVAKEALRRASILGEPIKIHQRLPRFKNKHLGLRPASVHESMGNHLIQTIGSSRFSNDTYWAHAALDKIGKTIVIVTLEHIVKINKCRLWGPWEIEWIVDIDDIISMPKMNCTELILQLRQNVGTDNLQKIKIVGQKDILIWLREKIEQAIIVSIEDKSWTLTET
ncbi:intermembrane lipid transfer protein VPS13A-like [Diorhabda carinulata]|uniref:intermembrane lipid transfer protein VPS13A-like n=1 Tax=Diorhabda carinulata TaxID=1163345 RepID=UPI0025A082CF|nr:intermembrane lipid transfer protein VPS13A-like [Diorhabda carinulata]